MKETYKLELYFHTHSTYIIFYTISFFHNLYASHVKFYIGRLTYDTFALISRFSSQRGYLTNKTSHLKYSLNNTFFGRYIYIARFIMTQA